MDLDTLNALWIGKRCADSPVRLMGFRGGLEPAGSPNAMGTYDDLIVVIIEGAVTFWKASVDPAPALIANPLNAAGAAQLCEGVHLMGRHLLHGKYPCFGQIEDVYVNRLSPVGSIVETQYGDFGICIHSGGAPDDVERFTAGCQIIHNPDGYFGAPTWGNFFAPILYALQAHSLSFFPYLLTTMPAALSAPTYLENL